MKTFDEYVALAEAGPRPHVRRPDSGPAPGDLRHEAARHRRSDRQGSQAPGHVRRDRPLRHRRDPDRDRLPPGQARAQVSRLRQSGGDLLRSARRPRRARGRARESSKQRAREIAIRRSPTRTRSRCGPTARCRTKSCSICNGCGCSSGPEDLPGYKGERAGLRRVRRRHQLQAGSGARRPRALQSLRRRALLRTPL